MILIHNPKSEHVNLKSNITKVVTNNTKIGSTPEDPQEGLTIRLHMGLKRQVFHVFLPAQPILFSLSFTMFFNITAVSTETFCVKMSSYFPDILTCFLISIQLTEWF